MKKKQPERIMVIDDDPDILSITKIALETIGGFTIEACSSGAEALSRIDSASPDLILLDSMMPDMDGEETFAALTARQQAPYVPVVFFTGRTFKEDVVKFAKAGCGGCTAKAVRSDDACK